MIVLLKTSAAVREHEYIESKIGLSSGNVFGASDLKLENSNIIILKLSYSVL